AQLPAQRHVNAVVIERRQIDRRKRPALELPRPGLGSEQLAQGIAAALGLQQPILLDRPGFADRAVHRTGNLLRSGSDAARTALQRAREKLVEAREAERIRLHGIGHVDGVEFQEAADQPILEPRRAHASGAQYEPRQGMLRQQVLKTDKQGFHAPADTMRRKSLLRASTVKGPVSMAASLPSGSMTKMSPE